MNIPRGILEIKISALASQAEHPIKIYCAVEGRAILAVKTLGGMGYKSVVAVTAGFDGLCEAVSSLG